jgi:hypothetical protein
VVLKVWWVFFLKFYTQKTKFPKISEFLCRHGAKIRQKKKKKNKNTLVPAGCKNIAGFLKVSTFFSDRLSNLANPSFGSRPVWLSPN